MNKNLVRKLFLYIVDQLQDIEAPISLIRLVKLLYLIDFEYFNRRKKTLTDINWIKYYYGPYFRELPNIINSLGIDLEQRETVTERVRGFTFKSLEEQNISGVVDFSTEGLINRVIKRWALEDRDALLRYVYSTLPVKYAVFEEQLNFTTPTWVTSLEEEFNLLDAASEQDYKKFEESLKG
jgi:hypothetical protein